MIIYKNKTIILPVGLSPQYTVSDSSVLNQRKTVDSSTNPQAIRPDTGFTGLSVVNIRPYVLDSKQLNVDANGAYVIESSANGLSRVDVSVNIDTSAYYTQGYNEGYNEGETVGYNAGYSTGETAGIVEGIAEQKAKLTSIVITENGEYTREDGYNDVSVNIDTSSYYNDGYSAGETAGIAEGIAEQKAKLDSSTFTSNGTYTREDGWNEVTVQIDGVNNQNKTVNSSTSEQTVTPDTGYTGLGQVVVNPYILDSSTVVYTQNGEYSVESNADGLSRVDVSVNIDTSSYYDAGYSTGYSAGETDGIAEGVAQQKALLDSSTFTSNGTYTREDGWNEVTVEVDTVNNQNKTIDSSTAQQVVTPDTGYTGLGQVTVNGVTSSIDANIQAGNIKQGVEILGVQGTFDGGTLQTKTVDSSTVDQTITPDSGNYGLSQVTVNKYTLDSKTVNSSTTMQVVNSSADGLSSVTILPYTLETKNVDASIAPVTVTPVSNGFSSVTVNAVTSSIDPNIVASNIKEGVTILGVQGNLATPTYDVSIYSSIYMASCYFETVYADMNDDCSVKFRGIPYTGSGWQFGVMADGKGTAITCSDVGVQYPWYLFWLDGGVFGTNNSDPSVYSTDIATYEFGIDNGTCYIKRDGVTLCDSARASGYEGSGLGWGIGGVNQGDGNFDAAPAPLYMEYCEFYRNGVLVNKYVPATDVSGNIILFDTITKTYTEKQGSGTATLGSYTGEEDQSRVSYSITPQTYQQILVASPTQPIGAVTVDPVTASIDDDIQPENIKEGVSILGVDGTYAPSIELKRAEYISNENDRSVYINTGIAPDNETVIEVTLAAKNDFQQSWGGWFGVIGGEYHLACFQYNNSRSFDGLYGPNGGSWLTGPTPYGTNGNTWGAVRTIRIGGSTSEFTDSSAYNITTDHTFYYDYDSSLWGTGNVLNSNWTGDQRIYIFAVSNGEAGDSVSQYAPSSIRIYRVRILKGQEVVYDALPYYNPVTENYCLLDNVSGTISAYSGQFTGALKTNPDIVYDNYVMNATLTNATNYTSRSSLGYSVDIGARGTTHSDLYFRCKFEIPYLPTGSSPANKQEICAYGDISEGTAQGAGGFLFAFGVVDSALVLYSTTEGLDDNDYVTLTNIGPGSHTIEVLPTNGGATYYPIYVDGIFRYTFHPTGSGTSAGVEHANLTWFRTKGSLIWNHNMYNGAKFYWIEARGYDGEIHKFIPIRYQGINTFYDIYNNTVLDSYSYVTHTGRDYLR